MADPDLVAPRPLTQSDMAHLRTVFELQLRITDRASEEDASDLLDYALDMIGRGKNVGSVMEELEFMQYDVCDAEAAQKIGKCLTSFLRELVREIEGETSTTKIDLSTKAACRKHSREMRQTLLAAGSVSAAQRSKMGIYNARGELTKQWAGVKNNNNSREELDFDARRREHFRNIEKEKALLDARLATQGGLADQNREDDCGEGEVNLSALASAAKHHREVDSIVSSFRSGQEGGQMVKKQIYDEKGQLNSWANKTEDVHECSDMDLSTQGNLNKKKKELEALRSTGAQRRGVKNKVYDESGQLHAQWNNFRKATSGEHSDAVMAETTSGHPPIERTGSGHSSTNQDVEEQAALDKQRRKEFEAVMRDRSLNREERARKIEEIKQKYHVKQPPPGNTTAVANNSSGGSRNDEDLDQQEGGGGGGVRLSAADAASKHHNELDFLRSRMKRGSVMTARDHATVMYDENGELLDDAAPLNNRGEQRSHNPDMDLSTAGCINKKNAELDAIRAAGEQRRGVKDKIYDSSGRLNAWTKLNDNVEVVVTDPNNNCEEMDLSARGMEMKKAREIESLRACLSGGDRHTKTQMYDADGRIVGASNNVGEQDRHNPDMDLSALGYMRKKSQEINALRATANPQGTRQKMYNERGELVGADNNCGEQDRHNPDMDLSAEGMKLKKAREMEALRAAGRQLREGAKKQMYDESGQLNAWNKEKKVEEKKMDLSTAGSINKKNNELDAIRAAGQQRRGVKDRIYDSSGRLNAWTSLQDKDEMAEQSGQYMDTSAEGMKLKKAREIESLRASGSQRTSRQLRYDADGKIIGAANNAGEQELSNEEFMDTSAEGMKLKKAREIASLRATGNQRTSRQLQYDADGNIIGAGNNCGEQDAHNKDMDLSAAGMMRKRSQEILSLRATANQDVKQKMYNSRGEIISANNNSGEQESHNAQMDVTASGMMKKKNLEIEAIRSGTISYNVDHNKTLATRVLSEDETSTLRTMLKAKLFVPNDSYEEDASDLLDYCFDMVDSGENVGFVVKELLFMEMDVLDKSRSESFAECLSNYLISLGGNNPDITLAQRSKTSIYDSSGRIIGNNSEKQEEHKIDLSTKAASRKPAKEMQATLASGPDSVKERSKQGIYDSQGRLVKQWANVNECGSEQSQGSENIVEAATNPKDQERMEEFQAIMRDRSISREERALRIEQLKEKYSSKSPVTSPEKKTAEDAKLDLSALAFARKANAEMKAALLSSERSAKERSKQEIYDADGNLVKQWNEEEEYEIAVHGINLSAQAAAKRAADEVDSLLVKKKSGGGLKDRLSKYQDFVAPRGGYHHEDDDHDEARMEALDLSAKAFARKARREVGATLSTGSESVKERRKQSNYDENGVLIKQWSGVGKKEVTDIDAHIDEQRRIYFQQLDDEKNLQDRLAKRDLLLEEKRKEQAYSETGGPELKLSAQSQAHKPMEEIEALRRIADSKGVKKEIYDENGVLIKQWANVIEDGVGDVGDCPTEQSLDAQRTEELQLIMKDHRLGHKEREQKIEEVKAKYDYLLQSTEGVHNRSNTKEPLVKVSKDTGKDEERMREFQAIMRDRTISREERAMRIEEMKRKYSQGSRPPTIPEKEDTEKDQDQGLDLSAAAFARKPSAEVKATLLYTETSAKEKSKQSIYDANGVLIKQWASVEKDDEEEEGIDTQIKVDNGEKSVFKEFMAKSVDEQRRDELQLIMRDRSLTKVERAERIEQVKARYAAAAGTEPNPPAPPAKSPRSNKHGKSKELDNQRRRELQSIMKNRSLDREEKTKLLEEVKMKYDQMEACSDAPEENEENDSPNEIGTVPPAENAMPSAVVDALHTENDSPNEDGGVPPTENGSSNDEVGPIEKVSPNDDVTPTDNASTHHVHWDLSNENGSSNKSHDVPPTENGSPNGIHDAPPAENCLSNGVHDDPPLDLSAESFSQKHLRELEAIRAKAAEGRSLKDRQAVYSNNTTVNYDSIAFAVSQNKSESVRKAAQRETVESAKQYNYSYGDGGAVDEMSAEFKAMGNEQKAAKKEAKESAKTYNYSNKVAPVIDCDPLAFAVKNNRSAAARKTAQRDAKESAKYYNYKYTG
eukprot:CAMPEP_0183710704 /NCGR_PEP_ID=MMETSP0737-20130205/6370_1 /TAXON_ID=385413 /ORGANISM="Thalassiosira miniscula, Strain CCMP1093" /LENGTH=2090 /DNA_ID=CAMNT_0025939029 /DNA_START=109 /DNA_END=6381 /DNA_ORIENTATION=-